MTDANIVARHIRGVIQENADLHHAYLHNASFHTAVNTATQATSERQAIRLLLDGMAMIARVGDSYQAELIRCVEKGPS